MIHEPPKKRHCSECLYVETDMKSAYKLWLGKVFHVVITLGTKDEYMY